MNSSRMIWIFQASGYNVSLNHSSKGTVVQKVCIVQEGVLLVWGWIVVKMIGASEVTGDGAGGLGQ